jgi:hypothetical protein
VYARTGSVAQQYVRRAPKDDSNARHQRCSGAARHRQQTLANFARPRNHRLLEIVRTPAQLQQLGAHALA